MSELYNFCREHSNDVEHRQARKFLSYLISILLGGDCNDVRFYNDDGVCFRHAMFN